MSVTPVVTMSWTNSPLGCQKRHLAFCQNCGCATRFVEQNFANFYQKINKCRGTYIILRVAGRNFCPLCGDYELNKFTIVDGQKRHDVCWRKLCNFLSKIQQISRYIHHLKGRRPSSSHHRCGATTILITPKPSWKDREKSSSQDILKPTVMRFSAGKK